MKAFKTPLAKQVLADGKAREQLRQFMALRSRDAALIEVRTPGGVVRLRAEVVPKAA